MGKKMYYTEEEAAETLSVSVEELANLVRDGKLRVFQDGMKKMFRVDEVDKLAGFDDEITADEGVGSTSGLADLMAKEDAGDAISLEAAEDAAPAPKEDTVITAEGISIFDDEDLEIEPADPMAKTQIAPSIEDQVTLEGVGSGSGLLDLTRESDDTSLGAEVLDNIDMEEGAAAPADLAEVEPSLGVVAEATAPTPAPAAVAAAPAVPAGPADASAGLFGGLIISTALVGLLLCVAALGTFTTATPDYLQGLRDNVGAVIGAAAFVILIGAVLGFLMGKASAARLAAARRMGG